MSIRQATRWLILPAAMTGFLTLMESCDTEPYYPRCSALQNLVSQCGQTCPPVECSEIRTGPAQVVLDSFTSDEMVSFEACIVCLNEEAALGVCRDCVLESAGESCRVLLSDWFGMDCLEL